MSDRFFVETPISGSSAIVTGAEAHHLAHVMRAQVGQQVILVDGTGAEFPATIAAIKRSEVLLDVLERTEVDRELPFRLVLGVCLPRGERQKWLVEKATELGVTELIPLAARHTVGQPGPGALDKLRRTVIEAAKQCGRNRLMEIRSVCDVEKFLSSASPESMRLFGHPTPDAGTGFQGLPNREGRRSLGLLTRANMGVGVMLQFRAALERPPYDGRPVYLAIGPEGGFTVEEAELAKSNAWSLVDLGPRILRIETAAIALVTMVTQTR